MIDITMVRDYNKDYNIKFDGLKVIDLRYEDGKLKSVRVRGDRKNYLPQIQAFKEYCKIETDDVITIVDMYFANEFVRQYLIRMVI